MAKAVRFNLVVGLKLGPPGRRLLVWQDEEVDAAWTSEGREYRIDVPATDEKIYIQADNVAFIGRNMLLYPNGDEDFFPDEIPDEAF